MAPLRRHTGTFSGEGRHIIGEGWRTVTLVLLPHRGDATIAVVVDFVCPPLPGQPQTVSVFEESFPNTGAAHALLLSLYTVGVGCVSGLSIGEENTVGEGAGGVPPPLASVSITAELTC